MIAPTLKGRVGGAQDREVPFEQVVLRGAVQKVTSTLRTVSSHHPTACRTQAYSWDRPPEQAGGGLTSRGLALYCGVGSLSSLASFSRRLTAVGGRVSHWASQDRVETKTGQRPHACSAYLGF